MFIHTSFEFFIIKNWRLQTFPQHMLKLLPLLCSQPSGVHNSNLVRSLKP